MRFLSCLLATGLAAALLLSAGCDTVEPEDEPRLVVEGFVDAGRPLPSLTLRRTQPLGGVFDGAAAVDDAQVTLTVDGEAVAYAPVPGVPGRYAPEAVRVAPPRSPVLFEARWNRQTARAESTVPAPVAIDSVDLQWPEVPVQAIQLDSLRAVLDSLNVDAETAFIYPVEVTLWWDAASADAQADTAYWMETQLRPIASFSSPVLDFFLLSGQVRRERELPIDARRRRRWTGVYAVQVEGERDPLPAHRLRVALLRSGTDYARFAASRDAPERREPLGNVTGGVGILAGIAVDSLTVQVADPAP